MWEKQVLKYTDLIHKKMTSRCVDIEAFRHMQEIVIFTVDWIQLDMSIMLDVLI